MANRARILAGPLTGEEGVLYAEIDTTRAQISRQQFDPAGHYSRSDVFRLIVDTSPRRAVTELNRCGAHDENPVRPCSAARASGATTVRGPNGAAWGRMADAPVEQA